MSRSTSFSLLRVPGLLSLVSSAVVSAAVVTACAGSDVPLRGDGPSLGGSAGQTGSNGGSASAGEAGSDGEGGSGMPAGGAGGASGAGGGDPQETGGTGGGGDDCGGAAILVTSCGAASCHGAGSPLGAFAASEVSLGEALGQAASAMYSSCGSGNLIDPDDVTQGVIYNKINGASCGGSPMPLGPALSPADKACVDDFLTGLAE